MENAPNQFRRKLLQFFLACSAAGWGICIAGVFAPTATAFDVLARVGVVDTSPMLADPMWDYWLRMASGAFAFIGIGYLILAIRPERFAGLLPFAGGFMVFEGVVLLVHGLRLGLPAQPFAGDSAFCLIGGIGILVFMRSVRSSTR